ncbi:MAG: hypothetical protein HY738_23440 [Bacteroidia bacterium]|nr:hypothetical protein [Bacteroidia bacterium]
MTQKNMIPDEALIEHTLIWLDLDELFALFRIFPKSCIKKVWKDKILRQEPMYHDLNRLCAFLLFNIKDPDKYIAIYKKNVLKAICKD